MIPAGAWAETAGLRRGGARPAAFGQQVAFAAQTPGNSLETAANRCPDQRAAGGAVFGSTVRASGVMGLDPRHACHAEGRGFESHHPL